MILAGPHPGFASRQFMAAGYSEDEVSGEDQAFPNSMASASKDKLGQNASTPEVTRAVAKFMPPEATSGSGISGGKTEMAYLIVP